MSRTEEQMRLTDEQMKRTDKKLDKVAKMLGSIGNNQGSVAEDCFVNSLKDTLTLAGMDFDLLLRGVELNKKSVRDEFDILLVNGNSVAIIEVKYKVDPKDIDKLPQKIKRIKLMLQYRDYKVYTGLAGFYIPSEVIESLQEQGYFALQRKGDVIESYTEHLRVS